MALTDESSNGMVMPAAPMYGGGGNGGFGFGGDWGWLILLLLVCGGGWGMGGFGGGAMWPMMMGGMYGADGFGLYPWLNNSQHISDGFRDQTLQTSISGLQNSVTSGFGDVQLGIAGINQAICQTGNGITAAVTGAQNAIAQQLYTNEIGSLNRSFAEQTANAQGFNGVQAQLANCCCENRLAAAENKYVLATEACATRTASAEQTRDIIDSQTRNTQAILDKLCALELDGVKGQLAQAQRENVALQNQINMANMQIGFNNETDALYNRLKNCPVPSMPVYGNVPIFQCQPQNGCGCGCGAA
jgi:hypothetical protein